MKPKQYFFLLVGLCLVVTIGGGVAYYFATMRLQSQFATARLRLAEVEVAQSRLATLARLQRQYQDISADLPLIDEALPRQKKQSEIILQLETLARQAGLSLPGVTFLGVSALPTATSQTVPAGDVLATPVTVSLSGSYEQLQTFLQSLERLSRYNSVSQITINRGDRPKALTFQLTINVFLKP